MDFALLIFFVISIALLILLISINQRQKVSSSDEASYEIPLTDSFGNKFENIWMINLSGVTHSHDGYNPQRIIPQLPIGARLILTPQTENEYDQTAIKVCTQSGKYVGWYPKDGMYHRDVFDRLTSGQEVNAQLVKKGQTIGTKNWWCEMKVVVYKK